MTHSAQSFRGLSTLLAVGALTCALPVAAEQDLARVVSTTPIVQQVPVNRQVCQDEVVTRHGQKSGAGALMGTIAGGAVGNAIGEGNGRTAATILGLVGGAILGNNLEGESAPEMQTVRRCRPETGYESRVSGYNVVYEFGGRQYSAQMPSDPGQYIQIQVQITPIIPRPPLGSGGYPR